MLVLVLIYLHTCEREDSPCLEEYPFEINMDASREFLLRQMEMNQRAVSAPSGILRLQNDGNRQQSVSPLRRCDRTTSATTSNPVLPLPHHVTTRSHLCYTPKPTSNQSVKRSFTLTQYLLSLYEETTASDTHPLILTVVCTISSPGHRDTSLWREPPQSARDITSKFTTSERLKEYRLRCKRRSRSMGQPPILPIEPLCREKSIWEDEVTKKSPTERPTYLELSDS
ncbi:hypothetical protein ScPMuIL_018607 [Solemya velum]